jgi:hypothetical protein
VTLNIGKRVWEHKNNVVEKSRKNMGFSHLSGMNRMKLWNQKLQEKRRLRNGKENGKLN